jgi:hypothetical protein
MAHLTIAEAASASQNSRKLDLAIPDVQHHCLGRMPARMNHFHWEHVSLVLIPPRCALEVRKSLAGRHGKSLTGQKAQHSSACGREIANVRSPDANVSDSGAGFRGFGLLSTAPRTRTSPSSARRSRPQPLNKSMAVSARARPLRLRSLRPGIDRLGTPVLRMDKIASSHFQGLQDRPVQIPVEHRAAHNILGSPAN